MELPRESEVRALERLAIGVGRHPEDLVVRRVEPCRQVDQLLLQRDREVETRIERRRPGSGGGRRTRRFRARRRPWRGLLRTGARGEFDDAFGEPALETAIDVFRTDAADLTQIVPRRPAIDPREQIALGRRQRQRRRIGPFRDSRNPCGRCIALSCENHRLRPARRTPGLHRETARVVAHRPASGRS